jgi:hypothetical protein
MQGENPQGFFRVPLAPLHSFLYHLTPHRTGVSPMAKKTESDLLREVAGFKLSHDSKKSIRQYADEAFEEKLNKAADHCTLSFANEVQATGAEGTPTRQLEALLEAIYHIFEPVRDLHDRVARIEMLLSFMEVHMGAFYHTLPYLPTDGEGNQQPRPRKTKKRR